MDWSCPTTVVVGNENRGISDEALEFSDMHCSIPMKGMVDSLLQCFSSCRNSYAPCCVRQNFPHGRDFIKSNSAI
nr:tRNA/rRNA methyltransferase [Ipomoea batatas]